jgi:transposase
MNTKLHATADAEGRMIRALMSAGQVGDEAGVAAFLGSLLSADCAGRPPLWC